MDTTRLQDFVERMWDDSIVPALKDYIRIPNQSPLFDPDWQSHGYMADAVELARAWVSEQKVEGAVIDVLELPGRTPLLLVDIDGSRPGTVLMYGHLDKQPPFEGWRTDEGLGPWTPVMKDGKLYGRGGADDGYAVFASTAAVLGLREQGIEHPRIVIAIECSEESGSMDLPAYIEAYADRIGTPDLVVCLDSGCGDYERMWTTTSLRGIVAGNLRIGVLKNGVHSGDASGIVASSFRILRILLTRLEDVNTGSIVPSQLHVEIPEARKQQAAAAADVLEDAVYSKFPFEGEMRPVSLDPADLIVNRTWRPALSVTGAAGMPSLDQAGNVLRPFTAVKLSLRIPPTLEASVATEVVKTLLESDPPYGASVEFECEKGASGWEAPALAPWLEEAMRSASQAFYGAPHAAIGEGGSIPFMGMLGEKFPEAQFLITGVLGPHSNAHGPNEFLHVPYAKRLTCCVAHVLTQLPR